MLRYNLKSLDYIGSLLTVDLKYCLVLLKVVKQNLNDKLMKKILNILLARNINKSFESDWYEKLPRIDLRWLVGGSLYNLCMSSVPTSFQSHQHFMPTFFVRKSLSSFFLLTFWL